MPDAAYRSTLSCQAQSDLLLWFCPRRISECLKLRVCKAPEFFRRRPTGWFEQYWAKAGPPTTVCSNFGAFFFRGSDKTKPGKAKNQQQSSQKHSVEHRPDHPDSYHLKMVSQAWSLSPPSPADSQRILSISQRTIIQAIESQAHCSQEYCENKNSDTDPFCLAHNRPNDSNQRHRN